jgi:lysozyme
MSHLSSDDLRKLAAQLMRHEGERRDRQGMHIAYRCPTGALTIGYGHNLDAEPVAGLGAHSRLGEDEALALLERDISQREEALGAALPFVKELAPARYAVLLNMCFNLGLVRLLSFRNTLADVRYGEYSSAARRMLQSRWARQVGRRAEELARQMDTGDWQ